MQRLCILCGKDIVKPNERRKLYYGIEKTEALMELEHLLGSTGNIACMSIICKYCLGKVKTVNIKMTKIKRSFAKNTEGAKEKHNQTVVKRILPVLSKVSTKTSLFCDNHNKLISPYQSHLYKILSTENILPGVWVSLTVYVLYFQSNN